MYLNDDQEDLLDAVADGNLRKVNALLKKGVDPDFEDDYRGTPLNEAIGNGNLGIVKALVNAGADVNRSNNTWDRPLDVADRNRHDKIIDYLESKGAQSADSGRLTRKQQALMDAVEDSDARKVNTLLAGGLDPDFMNDLEETPLDIAIREGNETIVRALVNNGADVNRVNSDKEAPLDVAKDKGATAIVQYLESEGAVPGKTKGKKGAKFSAKKSRGSSIGVQQDFDDDFWDDDFAPRKQSGGAKPKVKPKRAATQGFGGAAAPEAVEPKKQKPVFREDTLKDIFNPAAWVGKTEEMEELWNDVPKRLHKHFDFAAALAEARRETLKQNAPKQRFSLQANMRPQNQNACNDAGHVAPADAKEAADPAKPAPPAPPKPPSSNT